MEKSAAGLELKSEKVRNIVGKIPPILLRIGIPVVAGIMFMILATLYYVPYPETKTLPISVEVISGQYYAIGNLDIKNARLIKKGQSARMTIESIQGDYSIMGEVESIDEYDGTGNVSILLHEPTNDQCPVFDKKPSGEALIYISDESILKKMFTK